MGSGFDKLESWRAEKLQRVEVKPLKSRVTGGVVSAGKLDS